MVLATALPVTVRGVGVLCLPAAVRSARPGGRLTAAGRRALLVAGRGRAALLIAGRRRATLLVPVRPALVQAAVGMALLVEVDPVVRTGLVDRVANGCPRQDARHS